HLVKEDPVHVYRAGDFWQETPIPPNEELSLQGVDLTGTESLDTTKNAVLAKAQPQTGKGFVQSTIALPHPNKIYHFVCGVVDGLLADPDNELKAPLPKVISGTRVFQYSFTDFTQVNLLRKNGKPFWQCPQPDIVVTPQGPIGVALLEVYNEPPQDLGASAAQHNRDEFNDSLTFMQAKSVELLEAAADPEDCDSLPPGLTEDQVCSLDVRSVVAAHRQGKLDEQTDEIRFAVRFGKKKGGGGGTQVCGGANGILG
ncbi:MAG: hypothetical protein ACXV5R_13705, partial [Candidatus Angelobacter sp.]